MGAPPRVPAMFGRSQRPPLVIFTDLDGTFLDNHTYSYEAAEPAYRRCQAAGVPVVFCSSKTRAEVERLRSRIGSQDPFIVENGGAVYGLGSGPLELGPRYDQLTAELRRLSAETGVAVRGFHQMTLEEIAAAAGLSLEDAKLAAQRQFDEAFSFIEENPEPAERFLSKVEQAGLRWARGGRFHHLFGHEGKGAAVRAVAEVYRRENPDIVTVGLGDSANDIPMLWAVKWPIVVRKPGGRCDEEVLRQVPKAQRAPDAGPRGWNLAVIEVMRRSGLD